MNIKVRKDKQTGETRVEYYKVADKSSYRFDALQKIISGRPDITIIVDTNQRIAELAVDKAEDYFKSNNIKYSITPTQANKKKFFGLAFDLSSGKKKRPKEYIIILDISPEQLTQELFGCLLEHCDFAVGMGSKKSFEEIREGLRTGAEDVLFNRSFFEECVYDSIICGCMRCSFDIEEYAG